MKTYFSRKDDGFTFIETLIVLAIMIILSAGIGIPSLQYIEKAKRITAQTEIGTLRLALHSYYIDCGRYPESSQGLDALYIKPVMNPVPDNWNGPYIDKKKYTDPWGNNFVYICPGPDGLPYGILSYGSGGQEGGQGNESDIVSWE